MNTELKTGVEKMITEEMKKETIKEMKAAEPKPALEEDTPIEPVDTDVAEPIASDEEHQKVIDEVAKDIENKSTPKEMGPDIEKAIWIVESLIDINGWHISRRSNTPHKHEIDFKTFDKQKHPTKFVFDKDNKTISSTITCDCDRVPLVSTFNRTAAPTA